MELPSLRCLHRGNVQHVDKAKEYPQEDHEPEWCRGHLLPSLFRILQLYQRRQILQHLGQRSHVILAKLSLCDSVLHVMLSKMSKFEHRRKCISFCEEFFPTVDACRMASFRHTPISVFLLVFFLFSMLLQSPQPQIAIEALRGMADTAPGDGDNDLLLQTLS